MPRPRHDAARQAVSLLARREHSSRELRDKLRARGYAAEAVDEALAAVREEGLQSDRRFAEARSRSLMDRGYGSLRVSRDLRERGVSRELAHEFEALAREGDSRRAREALERGTRSRERALRFLAQRGYPGEVARRAVEEAFRGETE